MKRYYQENEDPSVACRERFTNCLARLVKHKELGSLDKPEAIVLQKEVKDTLLLNPEWTDIARSWLGNLIP